MKSVVLKINVTTYTFLESSWIGQIRFAEKKLGCKKFAQISKYMDLSDNYIFCISQDYIGSRSTLEFKICKNMSVLQTSFAILQR